MNLFAIVLSLFLWPPEVFPFQCHHLLFHSFVEYILLFSIPLLPPFNCDYLYLMSIIRPILKILHPLLLSYGPYTQTCASLYFSDGLDYWELRYFYFLYIFVGFFLFRKMSIWLIAWLFLSKGLLEVLCQFGCDGKITLCNIVLWHVSVELFS